MASWVTVYGRLGWELEVGNHIKTRLIFAVADEKLKRLAWYFYSQFMGRRSYEVALQQEFEQMTKKTPGVRNESFGIWAGDKGAFPNVFPSEKIHNLAISFSRGFDLMVRPSARLQPLEDEDSAMSSVPQGEQWTRCRLDVLDLNANPVHLQFLLKNSSPRRGFNVEKYGYLWLLKVEPYSLANVKRGIAGPGNVDGGGNPAEGKW
jgi:hypothetical protein